jgi:hypothetical protein
VVLAERQPGGRFAYEYDKPPYPPLAETANITLSPTKSVAEEAVKTAIVGSVTTVSSVEAWAVDPRISLTVQTTVVVVAEP